MTAEKLKKFLYRMLCGCFLGLSVIAPGVSSSVIALMMGIYEDLIIIVSNPFKNFKKNLGYIIPVGLGAILSIALFVELFAYIFENYPVGARLLFMGLIAGGLPNIFKRMTLAKFKVHYLVGLIVTFAIACTFGILARNNFAGEAMMQVSLWYLCVSGLVCGVCSMMPGMSISMILMLFSVYDYLLQTAAGYITNFWGAASVLLPFVICFALGMVLFSRVTKFVFERYTCFAYYLVFGFMCGSLTAIFPSSLPDSFMRWLIAVIAFLGGLGISLFFQRLGKKFNTTEE